MPDAPRIKSVKKVALALRILGDMMDTSRDIVDEYDVHKPYIANELLDLGITPAELDNAVGVLRDLNKLFHNQTVPAEDRAATINLVRRASDA
jgi:hypothetical protein